MRKKLNNLPETSSDETSNETSDKKGDDNNSNNDNDDSEDNQISNFEDRVLKKVSKEIVNDDNKSDDDKNNDDKNDENKKLLKLSKKNADLKKMKASKNLSNKQVRDSKNTLELNKNYSALNAKSIAKGFHLLRVSGQNFSSK